MVAQLRRIILDCAVELSPKTPVYATLIGVAASLVRHTILLLTRSGALCRGYGLLRIYTAL